MKKAKIFYFSLQHKDNKEDKLDWLKQTKFDDIPFDHITPDSKENWINLTDNDFDSFLPLIDKNVKAGKSQEAVFRLFSRGVATQRDLWVYDFSKESLIERMQYFIEVYQDRLDNSVRRELDIKWDRELEKYISRKIKKQFELKNVYFSLYRPYIKQYFYFDKHFNGMTYQMFNIFPNNDADNLAIFCTNAGTQSPFMVTTTNCIPDLHLVGTAAQCLPFYCYDENGNPIENITDWGLNQFQRHYNDPKITKEAIFHYTYAILHHPVYRTKYELNLKREFPRLLFYPDFQQWANWGKVLIKLHLNYETVSPYTLKRVDICDEHKTPKAKLKAAKIEGKIILDTTTTLEKVPSLSWEYKLGNRSALEWILDQYKEKIPKDPTIAKLFNNYRFCDYKEQVIDLLQRVCTVSIKTMEIIQQMPTE
jgi:predicted helicase